MLSFHVDSYDNLDYWVRGTNTPPTQYDVESVRKMWTNANSGMFKVSDNLQSSFLKYLNFKCTYFLQMKQRLPFWELTTGHLV